MSILIENDELRGVFWETANRVTTHDGVEIEYHKEETVQVSVTLRNDGEYNERFQLSVQFDRLADFIRQFGIMKTADLYEINIVQLLEFYRRGIVKVQEYEEV